MVQFKSLINNALIGDKSIVETSKKSKIAHNIYQRKRCWKGLSFHKAIHWFTYFIPESLFYLFC